MFSSVALLFVFSRLSFLLLELFHPFVRLLPRFFQFLQLRLLLDSPFIDLFGYCPQVFQFLLPHLTCRAFCSGSTKLTLVVDPVPGPFADGARREVISGLDRKCVSAEQIGVNFFGVDDVLCSFSSSFTGGMPFVRFIGQISFPLRRWRAEGAGVGHGERRCEDGGAPCSIGAVTSSRDGKGHLYLTTSLSSC